jgi:ubiquinone/menaquinone biosynthesis C-methylase UbiE
MNEQKYQLENEEVKQMVSVSDKIHFGIMSLVHETLYGLFRDPYPALKAAGLEPGQKVLEVGCGPGFFTLPAAKMVGENGSVHTLDVSPLAIEKVQQKIAQAGATNVKTLLTDAAQTGLPAQSFDLAFLFGLAHPRGGLDGILAELQRVLKPTGILAVEGRQQIPEALFYPLKRQGRISQFGKTS